MGVAQKDGSGNSEVMRQFLALPAVLGTLLVVTGVFGIYVSNHSLKALFQLNDAAIGPTIAFSEINENLGKLSQDLLRVNQFGQFGQSGARNEDRERLLKKSKLTLKKIAKEVKAQLEGSHGRPFEGYLGKWMQDWTTFQQDLDSNLESFEKLKPRLAKAGDDIAELIEKMNNVSSFIQSDAQDMMAQSTGFSKKASIALAVTLALGVVIGLLSSILIVRSIRKLLFVIAESKKNIETLLNNLDQGFLVFDRAGTVLAGVSRAAKDFLGIDPAGKPFHEVLPVDKQMQESVKGWQALVYGGDLRFVDFQPLAPQSFERGPRYIELDFRPIYGAEGSGTLDKVICIASDKTEERRLRLQAESEAALVKLVMAVLSDRGAFVEFVLETRNLFRILEEELVKAAPDFDLLLRGMHTLKGGCAAFNIIKISHEAHRLEGALSEARTAGSGKMHDVLPRVRAGLNEMKTYFESFLAQHEAIFGRIGDDGDRVKSIPIHTIHEQCQLIFKNIGKESPIFRSFVEKFVQEDLAVPFRRFEAVVKGIAERQLKKVNLRIEYGKARVFPDPYQALLSAYIHVFRNAMDHGIEDEVTRLELGKPEAGTIAVGFERLAQANGVDRLRITVTDDGQGIDGGLVRQKALAKGLITAEQARDMTESEACQLLFMNGFSTREEVSDLSGRGVGLDAVRFEATQLGGAVWLESKKGEGARLVVEVPFYDTPVFTVAVRRVA